MPAMTLVVSPRVASELYSRWRDVPQWVGKRYQLKTCSMCAMFCETLMKHLSVVPTHDQNLKYGNPSSFPKIKRSSKAFLRQSFTVIPDEGIVRRKPRIAKLFSNGQKVMDSCDKVQCMYPDFVDDNARNCSCFPE
jgi:hypothetical protein